jgi:hypothetical protein
LSWFEHHHIAITPILAHDATTDGMNLPDRNGGMTTAHAQEGQAVPAQHRLETSSKPNLAHAPIKKSAAIKFNS